MTTKRTHEEIAYELVSHDDTLKYRTVLAALSEAADGARDDGYKQGGADCAALCEPKQDDVERWIAEVRREEREAKKSDHEVLLNSRERTIRSRSDVFYEVLATLLLFVIGILGVWYCSHSGWAIFWAIVAGSRISK